MNISFFNRSKIFLDDIFIPALHAFMHNVALGCMLLVPSMTSASTLTDVQRQLFPDKAKILQANNKSTVIIESQNTTSNLNGVAILVGETGRPPSSQQNLAMLTQYLNDLGWVTMQITPPTIGFEPDLTDEKTTAPDSQSQASTTDESQDNTANDETEAAQETPTPANSSPASPQYQLHQISNGHFLQHEQELRGLMQAAMARAQSYSGFRLIIAQGTSAAWLIKIYAEKQIPSPDALVTISPFWPQRNLNALIANYTAVTEMPLLDIYSPQDNNWSLMSATQRGIDASKNLKLDYRQRQLTNTFNTFSDSAFVSKEIYGWLHYLGW
ncbi:hypothetical protein Patl_3832 [Paraglaciecola sp. T6c]|uniref:DUF3530 family protein n=1 Tax=Pseudoalteromonas atlantica (strain T6c / ATCC BAA-1087) TaxID=3042615 RepID=UPI00005C712C|nr:DUF3530 family protein [Paraglaciecola sp. T6c]ABG42332.1 hypothetical protein Patl_3832 [Paraglaciecola sp. T6c]